MTESIEPLLEEYIDCKLTEAFDRSDSGAESPTEFPSDSELFEDLRRAERCAHLLRAVWPSRKTVDPADEKTRDLAELHATSEEGVLPELELANLGRFRIERLLGAGGMAHVFLAFDPMLHRRVALKIPHPGRFTSGESRSRFTREARAAGKLRHPNIVAVHESGEVGAVCYIASEFCDGPTLGAWMRRRKDPIPPKLAARIVSDLATAMQHAHDRGIMHRDLKPGNVLLDPIANGSGDAPGAAAEFPYVPRVADFGLAIIDDDEGLVTHSEAACGTPAYMAPEQIEAERALIGPRTDVYGLGAMLYELTTGQSAFHRRSIAATLAAVQQGEPTLPRSVRPEIDRDLEAICLRALDRVPDRRYRSAAELADDLERYLNNEPVIARPIGVPQRVAKWVRRHPTLATLKLTILLASILLVGSIVWHNRQLKSALHTTQLMKDVADNAEAEAVRQQRRLESELYATDVNLAHHALRENDVRHTHKLLEKYIPDGWSDNGELRSVSVSYGSHFREVAPRNVDLRGWEWHYLWRQVHAAHREQTSEAGATYFLRYSPDERYIATGGNDGVVRIYDTFLLQVGAFDTGQREVNGLDYTADGRRLATAGDDGTVRIWDLATTKELLCIEAHAGLAYCALFVRNDRQLVTCGKEPVIRVWDAANGELVRELAGHQSDVENIALSPDGSLVVSASSDNTAKIWDLESGKVRRSFAELPGRVSCVDISQDGRLLAAGDITGEVRVWRCIDGALALSHAHLDGVQTLDFTSDSRWLSVGTRSGNIHLWPLDPDAEDDNRSDSESAPVSWKAHDGRVYCIANASQGGRLASVGSDGRLQTWTPFREDEDFIAQKILAWQISDVQPIPDSDDLLLVKPDAVGRFFRETRRIAPLGDAPTEGMRCVAVSQDGTQIAVGCSRGRIYFGTFASGFSDTPWQGPVDLDVYDVAYVDDGTQAFVNLGRESIQLIDIAARSSERQFEVEDCYVIRLSPNRRWLAAGSEDQILLWNLKESAPPLVLSGHTSTIRDLAFSPNGKLLASASNDRRVKIWEWEQGREQTSLEGHLGAVRAVSFSADGRTLFSSGIDVPLTVWHVSTGRRLFAMEVSLVNIGAGPGPGQVHGRTVDTFLWHCDVRMPSEP